VLLRQLADGTDREPVHEVLATQLLLRSSTEGALAYQLTKDPDERRPGTGRVSFRPSLCHRSDTQAAILALIQIS